VGFSTQPPDPGLEVAAGNVAAVKEAAELISELGHDVREVHPPWPADERFVPDSATLMFVDIAADDELPPTDTMSAWSRGLIDLGRSVSGVDYVAAEHRLAAAARTAAAPFGRDYDVLLTPTTAGAPPPVGEFRDIDIGNIQRLWALTPFCALWNLTGQPAVSIPWSLDEAGLPVGVQLVGPPVGEATLFRLSAQLEQARSWTDWRPPVS
jgi:amidase